MRRTSNCSSYKRCRACIREESSQNVIHRSVWSPMDDPEALLLYKSFGCDFLAGAISAMILAPFIATVDIAIIRSANGSQPLGQGLYEGVRTLRGEAHDLCCHSLVELAPIDAYTCFAPNSREGLMYTFLRTVG